jgi:hypothetical protein
MDSSYFLYKFRQGRTEWGELVVPAKAGIREMQRVTCQLTEFQLKMSSNKVNALSPWRLRTLQAVPLLLHLSHWCISWYLGKLLLAAYLNQMY